MIPDACTILYYIDSRPLRDQELQQPELQTTLECERDRVAKGALRLGVQELEAICILDGQLLLSCLLLRRQSVSLGPCLVGKAESAHKTTPVCLTSGCFVWAEGLQ